MKKYGERGSMTLLTVFVYCLFSTLGLGLIYISQVYLKLGALKKNLTLVAYASENGIKRGFGSIAEMAAGRTAPAVCSEEHYALLRGDTQAGKTGIVEEALGHVFPLLIEETAGDESWRSSVDFSLSSLSSSGDYWLADFKGTIASEGRLLDLPPKKTASLDVSLKILAGHIPLAYFPMLITGNLSPEEKRDFLRNRNITLIPPAKNQVIPGLNFAEASIMPENVDPLLKKALAVKILSPAKLTRAELRSALGLEMVNEPVPDGIYLISSAMGLGGIYAQGDIDELILAVDGGFQIISFRQGEESWILKFNPSQAKTFFITPAETREFDRVPLGIVMVNGCIRSLGGGIVDAAGRIVLMKDQAIPSVLQGVTLSIVSADQVTLSSHLIQQGVKWADGIPYLKDSTSQLMIYAAGRDFIEGTEKNGKIFIDPGAPAEMKIQAALAARNSIEVQGAQKTLALTGSLQTGELLLNGNAMKIAPDERLLENRFLPQNGPVTSRPMLFVLSLKPLSWNEH
jgi:hypothetical protein